MTIEFAITEIPVPETDESERKELGRFDSFFEAADFYREVAYEYQTNSTVRIMLTADSGLRSRVIWTNRDGFKGPYSAV